MSKAPLKHLVCNCQRTMEIDSAALARALGVEGGLTVHTELCRSQIASFEAAIGAGGALNVACTQEAPLFSEIAEEKAGADTALSFTNIREAAGWCARKSEALPKMAALLAAASYPTKPTGTTTLTSEGVCLVYGKGQVALDVATALADRLSVSLMLMDAADAMPPATVKVPIHKGRIKQATGHLGAFEITVDGYAPVVPSSRDALQFVMARDGAKSECDLIIDLTGDAPLFSGDVARDGYLRVDPGHPAAVANAMFKATDLVGAFEKPIYVDYEADICAHARNQIIGCRRCLDNCPTGAISPDGDHVAIDPAICGGCGNCSAVCPTGAVSYAYPGRQDLVGRVQVMLETYRKAGGVRPVLLLHDESHGAPLISASARFGRGLPSNVLPVSLFSVFEVGHDAMSAMLAGGAEQIVVLAPPDKPHDMPALEAQSALLQALLGGLGYDGERLHLLVETDPDVVESRLHELEERPTLAAWQMTPTARKRELARNALLHLHERAPAKADIVALPAGSPYGRIRIDTQGCTLCLACVGACPAGALGDNPDRPEVRFTEAACVQCGVCVATCPEKVITLEPRYDFRPAALSPEVLNGEEPFHCISCGKPFGTKATINKVVDRLKGRHAMFQNEKQLALIQMCDTCRVVAVSEEGMDPMRVGERPRIRTTDDYLAAEAEAKKTGKTPDDFIS